MAVGEGGRCGWCWWLGGDWRGSENGGEKSGSRCSVLQGARVLACQ